MLIWEKADGEKRRRGRKKQEERDAFLRKSKVGMRTRQEEDGFRIR